MKSDLIVESFGNGLAVGFEIGFACLVIVGLLLIVIKIFRM